MKPHKWAKEIKAWADGQQVQYRTEVLSMNEVQWTKWEDVGDINTPPAFFSGNDFEYRIKPQPKEPQYLYVYQTLNGIEFGYPTQIHQVHNHKDKFNCIGKIKLEQE